MARRLTIVTVLGLAAIFGWGVPLARLFDAFQPMIVSLSIMIAAILVRLNRGMPTLEWKSLDLEKRTQLTGRIVDLSREYGWIIAINGLALAGLVALTVVGKAEVQASWPEWARRLTAAFIGGGAALCVARMSYVIWRDLDIVQLQKQLIDASAARDEAEADVKSSTAKIADIRAAGLKNVAVIKPKNWRD
jgi:hypothetical protein